MNDKPTVRQWEVDRQEGRFVVLTLDNPPINAASTRLRADLLAAMVALSGRVDIAGVVIHGANGKFVAGADIREFDLPPEPPAITEVIRAIETCPVPVGAAIEGMALGGGYEIALACDARVGTPSALVGLPEVTLGLIPGGGGTQRLPRIVSVAEAIEIITSGRRIGATEALALGMLDAVVDGDLIEGTIVHLCAMRGRKSRLMDLQPRASTEEEIARVEQSALRRGRGVDAVGVAASAIRNSMVLDSDSALQWERTMSLRLRLGPQSRALRHLFFAERAVLKIEGTPAPLARVGVVGGGTMGTGIASAFAASGLPVILVESSSELLTRALLRVQEQAEAAHRRGKIASVDEIVGRVSGGALGDLGECDLVIEAIIEDMEAKSKLFATLDRIVAPEAILASNTSYLDIGRLASATRWPERVGGLHFFNPPLAMRLVEVVRAKRTSPETISRLLAVAKRLGKLPVVARVGEGFIGNRIFAAYRAQSEFLLEEGCYPADVDGAMREFGMPMGPFQVSDLAGLDIAWAMRRRLEATRDPRARYVEIPDMICERGWLGKKAGRGWYNYEESADGIPDSDVNGIIEAQSAAKGIRRHKLSADEIRSRLLAAMMNEAAHVLYEEIASCPTDIDIVTVHGYGFPAFRGGLMYWAMHESPKRLLDEVHSMAAHSGVGVRVAENLDELLRADGSDGSGAIVKAD